MLHWAALERALPFILRMNRRFEVVGMGPSLAKVVGEAPLGRPFDEAFKLERPSSPTIEAAARRLSNRSIIYRHEASSLRLRSELVDTPDELVLVGSPAAPSLAWFEEVGLQLGDFAKHDALPDLLLSLQARDASLAEARTMQAKLEAQAVDLEAARRRAEASAQAKGLFLATMSHELRTPLNAIINMAECLQEDLGEGEHGDLASTMLSAASGLLVIVDDILDLSKVEAGKLELAQEPFCPGEVLASVGDVLRPLADAKQLDLRVVVRFRGAVAGDAHRLRQILLNLATNAVKFTERGSVEMGLAGGPGALEFWVADTGIGMSPEQQAKVFSPFTQADSSTSRRFGGTGLGLSIVQRFVECMGGRVELQSEPGRGSRFDLRLPLPASSIEAEPQPNEAPALGGHALIVDDNPVNLAVAARVLKRLSWSADCASGTLEAMERLRARDYDVVLLDQHMPELDGLECARRIRAWEAEEGRAPMYVVALTADAFPSSRAACLEAGMDGFLTKPLRRAELARALRHERGDPETMK